MKLEAAAQPQELPNEAGTQPSGHCEVTAFPEVTVQLNFQHCIMSLLNFVLTTQQEAPAHSIVFLSGFNIAKVSKSLGLRNPALLQLMNILQLSKGFQSSLRSFLRNIL